MTEHDDLALERLLEQALNTFDPVQDRLIAGATAAFELRTLDTELAELIFDSVEERDAVLVRGPDEPRMLTFQTDPVTIELEVFDAGSDRRIIGRVSPAVPTEIEYRHGAEAGTEVTDGLGRFVITTGAGTGPLRLRCRPAGVAGARPVVTQWVIV